MIKTIIIHRRQEVTESRIKCTVIKKVLMDGAVERCFARLEKKSEK